MKMKYPHLDSSQQGYQHLEKFKNKFLKEYIDTNEVISDMHHIEWFPFILIQPMLI